MWAAVFFTWILLHLKTTQSATDCGVQLSSEGRIVGGEDMQRYKYPWYALLHPPRDVTTPLCSGVLIDSLHVLTAAHCYSAYEGDNYKEKFGVTLGMYNRCINESTRVTFSVNKVVIHQNFVPPVNDYDIAIITLNQTANFTPICLPGKAERNLTDRIGEIMGFGETAEDNITMPCVLQDAYIQIFPDRKCDRSTEPNPKIICAGVIGGGVDSCQGDSGGPLQVVDTGAFVLAGLVSYGFGCGKSGYPGVYTDVYYFLDWIEANI